VTLAGAIVAAVPPVSNASRLAGRLMQADVAPHDQAGPQAGIAPME
jgi:hypothetical protein